jgi:hypothetical protein
MSEKLGTIVTCGHIQGKVRETYEEIKTQLEQAGENGSLFIELHDYSDNLPQTYGVMHLAHMTPARPARPQIDTAAGVPLVGLGR